MENSNTRAELERIKNQVLQHLQSLPPVPSVAVAVMPPATRVSLLLTLLGVLFLCRSRASSCSAACMHQLDCVASACSSTLQRLSVADAWP
jgi:hypothetical protein